MMGCNPQEKRPLPAFAVRRERRGVKASNTGNTVHGSCCCSPLRTSVGASRGDACAKPCQMPAPCGVAPQSRLPFACLRVPGRAGGEEERQLLSNDKSSSCRDMRELHVKVFLCIRIRRLSPENLYLSFQKRPAIEHTGTTCQHR